MGWSKGQNIIIVGVREGKRKRRRGEVLVYCCDDEVLAGASPSPAQPNHQLRAWPWPWLWGSRGTPRAVAPLLTCPRFRVSPRMPPRWRSARPSPARGAGGAPQPYGPGHRVRPGHRCRQDPGAAAIWNSFDLGASHALLFSFHKSSHVFFFIAHLEAAAKEQLVFALLHPKKRKR